MISTKKRTKKQNVVYDCKPWELSDNKLAAEASQRGIRVTARNHNMSFSPMQIWTKQEFGDLPGDKKRLHSGGRRLK